MAGVGNVFAVSGDEGRLASALTRSGLLQGLDEGRRDSLLRLRCHEYSFSQELCHEGDRATSFLLLTRGTPEGGAGYGSIRASTDLAAYLDDRHLRALPGSAEVQVKTDLVRFVHSKPE